MKLPHDRPRVAALRERLRALFFRRREEAELEEELRFHIGRQTEANIRLGMAPKEARRQALLKLGGVEQTKEDVRRARGTRWLEDLAADVRYAGRTLHKSPGFAAAAILTLALGIGANTGLFGLIDALVNRPPTGVPASDRTVRVTAFERFDWMPYPDFRDLRDAVGDVVELGAFIATPLALGSGGEPTRVTGQLVSGSYFDVLGVRPALGRTFLPQEDRTEGAHPVAVIGHGLWQRRFAADPDIVGRSIVLNGHEFTVVGVAPEGFVGTRINAPAEVWVPTMMHAAARPREHDVLERPDGMWMHVVGRLAPGIDLDRANAALAVAGRAVDDAVSNRSRAFRPTASRLTGWVPPADFRTRLSVTGIAWILTGLVLLVACANVANLLLARAVRRRREIGVRLALGVGRGRLIRMLLVEALLLALVAGALGTFVAYGSAHWFQSRFAGLIAGLDVSPDLRTLGFSLGLATVTGVLFGLLPARRVSRTDVVSAIKDDGTRWFSGRSRLQAGLVVAQVAASVVLLAAAGMILDKARRGQDVDVGFATENVLAASFDLHTQGYADPAKAAFRRELLDRIRRLSGVRAATVTMSVPLSAIDGTVALPRVSVPGDDAPDSAGATPRRTTAALLGVRPGFFRTLEIPVLSGRAFEPRDMDGDAYTAVVSESFAREFFDGEDPVGRRIYVGGDELVEVVGMTRDISYSSVGKRPGPHFFVPAGQHLGLATDHLLVRTAGDPAALTAPIQALIRELDPRLPVFDLMTLHTRIDAGMAPLRTSMRAVAGFGLVALLLAALGLYGVVAFGVAGRAREIGVRIALGARPSRVIAHFIRDGAHMSLIGLAIGSVLALAFGRLLGSMVPGIRAADPATYLGVGFVLAAVTLVTSWLSARRAARVDPMAVLKSE